MKKTTIALLIVLFALSMVFAIYEAHNARHYEVEAEKTKIALNEKIRMLQDTLRHMSARYEIEQRHAAHFKRATKSMAGKEEEVMRAKTGM